MSKVKGKRKSNLKKNDTVKVLLFKNGIKKPPISDMRWKGVIIDDEGFPGNDVEELILQLIPNGDMSKATSPITFVRSNKSKSPYYVHSWDNFFREGNHPERLVQFVLIKEC